MTNWDEVNDFNDQINKEIASYAVSNVILNPDKLLTGDFIVPALTWQAIRFGEDEIEQVPDDRRGVYAFAIRVNSNVLPPHGYILYIGIAGRNSDRSLRERYRDYLSPKRVIKRGQIARVIGNWRQVLQFLFAPVDDNVSNADLENLERQLNTAFDAAVFETGHGPRSTSKKGSMVMMTAKLQPAILPALRGIMGNWVYYSCLMQFGDLSARVNFADEIHDHDGLSEMIQRALNRTRRRQIADYVKTQPQRFFNSLVIAVYGGEPNWHALNNVRNTWSDDLLQDIKPETIESVGFLTLRGDEKLFALDGQHRLAGIKSVVSEGYEPAMDDEVSVILVAHERTPAGLERTRRLFTTLNKTARAVTKGDIIALDEDDVMAICVRRLIEQTDLFPDQRILFVQSNNIPPGNFDCLTTIGNLYDVLTILFTQTETSLRKPKSSLQKIRPDDETLDRYFDYAREFFARLRDHFPELDEFFSAQCTRDVVQKYRGDEEGNALYRPIGLDMFTRIIARVTREMPLDRAIATVSKLPRKLSEPPYPGLMWNQSTGNIITGTGRKVTLREILCYMIGKNGPDYPATELLNRYRRETGNEHVTLPIPLV